MTRLPRLNALITMLIPVWAASLGIAGDDPYGAQWRFQNPSFTASAQEIRFSPNGIGVGVANRSIIRSVDGGASWFEVGGALEDNQIVDCIAFADDKVALGAGYFWEGGILRTVDGGASWTFIPNQVTTSTMLDIAFADGKTAVAVGVAFAIMRTTDAGLTWSGVPDAPLAFTSFAIDFATDKVGIILTGEGNIRRTGDAGATWEAVPAPSMDSVLLDVEFADAKVGVAVGYGSLILRTADAGLTWKQANHVPGGKPLRKVAFGDGGKVFAMGDDFLLGSEDYGQTWSRARTASAGEEYRTIAFHGKGGWTISTTQGMLRSLDDSRTWSGSEVNLYVRDFRALAMASASVGVAVGDDGLLVRFRENLAGGDPIGMLASPATFSGTHLRAAAFADTRNLVVAGDEGMVFRTANSGETWTRTAQGLSSASIRAGAFAGANAGCLVGSAGTVLRTTDAGANWTAVAGIPTTEDLHAVAFGPGGTGLAAGGNGVLLRTNDLGSSWSVIGRGMTAQSLRCLAFRDAKVMVAGGEGGELLRTGDGGATWAHVVGLPEGDSVRSVSFSALGIGVALLTGQGGVWGSADGGLKWTRIAGILGLTGFQFINRTRGYAVGEDGQVLLSGDLDGQLRAPTLIPSSPQGGLAGFLGFNWNPVPWADSYRLEIATDTAFRDRVFDTLGITDTTLQRSSLDPLKTFYWRVSAYDFLGQGPVSLRGSFRGGQSGIRKGGFPNPGLSAATGPGGIVRYHLSGFMPVSIRAWSPSGRLVSGKREWDGPGTRMYRALPEGAPMGQYILELKAGSETIFLRVSP